MGLSIVFEHCLSRILDKIFDSEGDLNQGKVDKGILKCCFGLLLAIAHSYAQIGTTSLQGVVTDKSRAVVPGAAAVLTNTAQGIRRAEKTNRSGEYRFGSLPPRDLQPYHRKTGFPKGGAEQPATAGKSPRHK